MSEKDFELLLRYCHETGFTISMSELKMLPRYRYVWGWWMALCYYNIRHNFRSIDDAPPGMQQVTVTDENESRKYDWVNGRYELKHTLHRSIMKDIYGS